jgi:hypothetical protein
MFSEASVSIFKGGDWPGVFSPFPLLSARVMPGMPDRRPKADPDPPAADATLQAYIREKEVNVIFAKLMQTLVLTKPEDPFSCMVDALQDMEESGGA